VDNPACAILATISRCYTQATLWRPAIEGYPHARRTIAAARTAGLIERSLKAWAMVRICPWYLSMPILTSTGWLLRAGAVLLVPQSSYPSNMEYRTSGIEMLSIPFISITYIQIFHISSLEHLFI